MDFLPFLLIYLQLFLLEQLFCCYKKNRDKERRELLLLNFLHFVLFKNVVNCIVLFSFYSKLLKNKYTQYLLYRSRGELQCGELLQLHADYACKAKSLWSSTLLMFFSFFLRSLLLKFSFINFLNKSYFTAISFVNNDDHSIRSLNKKKLHSNFFFLLKFHLFIDIKSFYSCWTVT